MRLGFAWRRYDFGKALRGRFGKILRALHRRVICPEAAGDLIPMAVFCVSTTVVSNNLAAGKIVGNVDANFVARLRGLAASSNRRDGVIAGFELVGERHHPASVGIDNGPANHDAAGLDQNLAAWRAIAFEPRHTSFFDDNARELRRSHVGLQQRRQLGRVIDKPVGGIGLRLRAGLGNHRQATPRR